MAEHTRSIWAPVSSGNIGSDTISLAWLSVTGSRFPLDASSA